MPNRPHISDCTPLPTPVTFSAIPAYYTPFPQQSPTHPGWYCCELAGGRIKHLTWKCGSFWEGDQEYPDVAFWVELPEFLQRILQNAIQSATQSASH